jgi:phosphoglycolate phosphatase/putative hydrolase of the HAD superfamily
MESFGIRGRPGGIIFDIDGTLYSDKAYGRAQIDVQVERLARERGEGMAQTRRLVEDTHIAYERSHGGKKTSLGNVFASLGVPIETSVRWREELLRPEDYLKPDLALRDTLTKLKANSALCAVTNNPVSVGRSTLRALGVEEAFLFVIGLDTTGRSKPDPEPFLRALALLGLKPEECVSVGDRYDVDCAVPLSLGMGAILVNGVSDVYGLETVFAGAS